MNKLRGTFNVVAVKAPGYGDRRKEMLQDIAILTGGTVISEELGLELKDTTLEQLGRCKSARIEKENTIKPFASLSDDVITLAVFKKAERGDDFIIRLFNPTSEVRKTDLTLPAIGFEKEFTLGAYEIKTLRINLSTKEVKEVSLTEK